MAAVVEDVGVCAAGYFKGVSEDGQTVECPLVVDGLGEFGDGAIIPGQPRRVDDCGTEGVAEDFTHQDSLMLKFNEGAAISVI
jgi:hypothetical protein